VQKRGRLARSLRSYRPSASFAARRDKRVRGPQGHRASGEPRFLGEAQGSA
jgi:hypothetical protein